MSNLDQVFEAMKQAGMMDSSDPQQVQHDGIEVIDELAQLLDRLEGESPEVIARVKNMINWAHNQAKKRAAIDRLNAVCDAPDLEMAQSIRPLQPKNFDGEPIIRGEWTQDELRMTPGELEVIKKLQEEQSQ